jgi:hypothetical protein
MTKTYTWSVAGLGHLTDFLEGANRKCSRPSEVIVSKTLIVMGREDLLHTSVPYLVSTLTLFLGTSSKSFLDENSSS